MLIELKKDIEVSSKTVGNYWLRFINLQGKFSYELFTKEIVLELKEIAVQKGKTELHNWFKKMRPAIFASSISDDDPNKLIAGLTEILKNYEV